MPETSHASAINLREVSARADSAQHIIIGFARAMPSLGDLWQQISYSLSDIPILALEIGRLGTELMVARLHWANLVAAARATLAAHGDGEPDPLFYLRDELDAQGLGTERRPA
jgi:hypothetical protein